MKRPETAKPRDPDSYEFNDDQLEKDYRKMYDTLHEIEEDEKKAKAEKEGKEVKKQMEAALLFNDVHLK